MDTLDTPTDPDLPQGDAPLAAPQDLEQDPPRPTLRVRLLVDGPMGELGTERSDLPADWLAEHVAAGRAEVIS